MYRSPRCTHQWQVPLAPSQHWAGPPTPILHINPHGQSWETPERSSQGTIHSGTSTSPHSVPQEWGTTPTSLSKGGDAMPAFHVGRTVPQMIWRGNTQRLMSTGRVNITNREEKKKSNLKSKKQTAQTQSNTGPIRLPSFSVGKPLVQTLWSTHHAPGQDKPDTTSVLLETAQQCGCPTETSSPRFGCG